MKDRSILVHEYVTGGGFAPLPELPSLCAEGETMLRAVIQDLKAWGTARIVSTRDQRLNGPPLAADEIIPLSPDIFSSSFASLAAKADACLLIAPEEHGILAELSETVLNAGSRLIGSLPQGIRTASDKWVCHQLLQQAGLQVPRTEFAPAGKAREVALNFGFPLVLKTIDGQGSLGVCLATNQVSLAHALDYLPQSEPLLVQRYLQGEHTSVSLLVSATGIRPICANRQRIVPGIPFTYHGGSSPYLKHPDIEKAIGLAVQAVKIIPGLRGFVGVDLILSGGECVLIELNPRVTVAYAGVRNIVNCNLAEAISRACLEDELPEKITFSGFKQFNPRESVHA